MASDSALGNKKYLLIIGDIIVLYFSLFLTLLIRYQDNFNSETWSRHLLPFSFVFLIFVIVFYIDDLYELSFNFSRANLIGKILKNTLVVTVIALGFFYLGQDRLFTIRPQRVLLINSGLFILISYGWHLLYISITKSDKRANNLLIIGDGELVSEIKQEINNKPQLGFKVKQLIQSENDFTNLKDICQKQKINTIISAINPRENNILAKSLVECLPLKIHFFDIANFYEKITGKVPIATIQQVWFLENIAKGNNKLYEITKIIFEILVSVILLILFLPFSLFVVLAVKSTPGPVFFKQDRVGKDGKIFKTVKFRSMVVDAEKSGAQWATKNDQRVTKFGRFMRKTRIDEIPQLFNVIMGQISLIGPRPERPEFTEQLAVEIPYYKERLMIKPGVTGWAQVMGPQYGGSKEETFEKLKYDLYYIKNRSLALDLSITLKTIKTVLSRRGH